MVNHNIGPKILREKEIVKVMIHKYCNGVHDTDKHSLCGDCTQLNMYADERLTRCIFAEEKPFCSKCPIHCYKPDMRSEIKAVMKFSGPRMLFSHPKMAIEHMLWRFKKFDDPRKRTV